MGGRYIANCPFPDHADKTPSFTVDANWYKCFGCGRSGDVINFVQEYFGISFVESIRFLAKELGIVLQAERPSGDRDLYAVLEAASLLYQEALERSPLVLQYLRSRGITDHNQSRLGWSGNGLLPAASLELLTRAGLVRDGRPFFRNRLMFPILRAGKVCGFGARTISDEKPKYLNSPETEVFQKSIQLYSVPILTRSSSALQNTHTHSAFVVEGYTDVLALARIGLRGFAPMGTALTSTHLDILWREYRCVYLAFDGDVAGRRATDRAIHLALPDLTPKRVLKIMNFKPREDPGSVIEWGGAERWKEYQDAAVDMIEVFWAQLDVGTPEDRAREMQRVRTEIERIKDQGLRASYARALRLRRSQSWAPKVRALPPRQTIHCIYGVLWKYPEFCVQYQEQIAELCDKGVLRESALRIAEGVTPLDGWDQASVWAEEFEDPREVLDQLFAIYRGELRRASSGLAKAEYLRDPSPDRWKKFVECLDEGGV
jgi:DNA primase